MPRVFLSTQDRNKARADLWEQDARRRIADDWEQKARLQLPNLLLEAQQKLASVRNPAPVTPAAPPALPSPASLPTPSPPATYGYTPPAAAAAPAMPAAPDDYRAYARQAAQRAGYDPDLFERQIDQESHFDPNAHSPAGAQGIAQIVPQYHPGVDTSNPQASLDYAAGLMAKLKAQHGSDDLALVAYNGGQGAVNAWQSGQPYGESQAYVDKILHGQPAATAGNADITTSDNAVIRGSQPATRTSQFGLGLSDADAYAFCGPAAAMAFAQTYGRNPSAPEAKQLAEDYGWTPQQGMAGIQSEQKMLTEGLGIPTKIETNVDWSHVANDASGGNPVIISTPGHYFFVTADPATGKSVDDQGRLFVGTSGTDLRGGSQWMSPDEMQQRMGAVQGALYADNPRSPVDSIAKGVGDFFSGVGSAVQGAVAPSGQEGITQGPSGEPANGAHGVLDPIKTALTEEQPWMRNLVIGQTKRMQGEQLTPQQDNAMARSMTTGLVNALAPEDLLARAATTGVGSLSRSAQVAKDVATSKLPAEAEAGFAMGLPTGGLNQQNLAKTIGQKLGTPGVAEDTARALRKAPEPPANLSEATPQGFEDAAPQASDDVLAGLLEMARSRGLDTTQLERQLTFQQKMKNILSSKQSGQANVGFATGGLTNAIPPGRQLDYNLLASLRRGTRTQQPGLMGMPTAKPNTADKVIAFSVNNMLSATTSLFTNAIGNVGETLKRPIITAASGDLGAAGADLRAVGHAIGDALADAGQTLVTGVRPSQAAATHIPPNAFPGKSGLVATPFLRAMSATDEFARAINAAGGEAAELVRVMRANPTLTQADIQSRFGARIIAAGERAAQEATYESGGTGLGKVISGWRAQMTKPGATGGERVAGLLTNVIMPFSNIPDAILWRGVKRIPVFNEVTMVASAARSLKAGNVAQARREVSAGLLTSAINLGILSQVMEGNITGAGPSDPGKRARLEEARDADGNPVWQRNSVRIGGKWVAYSSLGPIALQLGAVSNAVENWNEEGQKVTPDMLKAIFGGLGETVMDAWYLRGLSDLFIGLRDGRLPEALGNTAMQAGERLVPEGGLLNEIRGFADQTARDPQNAYETMVANRVPALSGTVRPRVERSTGQPAQAPKDLSSLVIRSSAKGTPNPVGVVVAEAGVGISSAPETLPIGKSSMLVLSDQEQHRFDELLGQQISERLGPVTADADFKAAPVEWRKGFVQKQISKARDTARALLLQEIGNAAIEQRLRPKAA